MAQAQVHKQPAPQKQKHSDAEVPEVQPKDERNAELDADVDELLAEIDAVLEPEAEEFVRGYVQKNGQ